MGQNPRKGITHTWDDVQAELCDVILTAMVALATITPEARKTFDAHLARVADRSLQNPSLSRVPALGDHRAGLAGRGMDGPSLR